MQYNTTVIELQALLLLVLQGPGPVQQLLEQQQVPCSQLLVPCLEW